MGKPTGFLEFERKTASEAAPAERIKSYSEFHLSLNESEQKKQAARCMDCGVPFCQSGLKLGGMTSGCPLNNLIPEWNDLIYRGKWELALKRLVKTNPFPEFTSRVCPALCEAACTCGLNGQPVSVKENEHAIIEKAFKEGYIKPCLPKVRTDKKIAVVGSGPSGLAAAYMLNKRGHNVTVYERADRAGGLLMYGIPNMKLEKWVIERRVEMMEEEGVEFKLNADIGRDIKASELLYSYDAVILACGAENPRDIKAEGRDANGIYFAVDFLTSTTKSLLSTELKDGTYISAKGKNVLVIGGGDTGNDCVGTAVRHGCKSVVQLEMMPKPPVERTANNAWPEWPKILKVDYGQTEAIAKFGSEPRIWQTTVKEFQKDEKGNVKSAIIQKLEPKKGENGRLTMQPTGEEFTVKADIVLIAAGFLGSRKYVAEAFGAELDDRTNVKADIKHKTNVQKLYTAGDMHTGQSLVVSSIREGIEAARAVDEYLFGYTNL